MFFNLFKNKKLRIGSNLKIDYQWKKRRSVKPLRKVDSFAKKAMVEKRKNMPFEWALNRIMNDNFF